MNREDIIAKYEPGAEELAQFNYNWKCPEYRDFMVAVCSANDRWVATCARSVCFGDQITVDHDIPGSRFTLMEHLYKQVDLIPLAILAGAEEDGVGRLHVHGRAMCRTTPLGAAVAQGRADVAEELLGMSCDPNCYGEGVPPLCIAVGMGDRALVELLLEWDADPDPQVDESCPFSKPLDEAVRGLDSEIAGLLVEHGADPNKVSAGALAGAPSTQRMVDFIRLSGYSLFAPRGEERHLVWVLAHRAFEWEDDDYLDKLKAVLRMGADPSLSGEYEALARSL